MNLTIEYPKSWAAAEGERPNIVQKFVSEDGRGFEMAMIITIDLELPAGTVLSEEEQRDFFSDDAMRDMLPPNATLVGLSKTQIEGVPAAILSTKWFPNAPILNSPSTPGQ